ncbi:MAG: amidohydrolase family protein, partial [Cyclobacteriaceae bacterium]
PGLAQPPAPANTQEQAVVVLHATAHLGDGSVIQDAALAFDQGKITVITESNELTNLSAYKVIDGTGKHIYPGLILPNTDLGLTEVSAVRATRDNRERGTLNPNVRSIIAYNADSELIPTLRYNGILVAQVASGGGLVSGTSSVVQLDAWNWEDAALKTDDGIYLNWPRLFLPARWWMGENEARNNPRYGEDVAQLEKLFSDAATYFNEGQPAMINLKLEAMKGLFDGSKKLFIRTNRAKEILESVQFAQKHGANNIVLVGASDAWVVKDFIKKNSTPVILNSLHRLPSRIEDDVDLPYKLPYLLHQEGIKVALGYLGTSNARNLPFLAGTAAAYGLNKEQALSMVTSQTASILGIDDRVGSLQEGLDATFVISEGDLLDMRSSRVEMAFIGGKQLELEGKQQRLFKKYKQKYEDQAGQ